MCDGIRLPEMTTTKVTGGNNTHGKETRELEVIVAIRPFHDANWDPVGLYKRCSPATKRTLLHLGICHYMTAFRDASTGRMTVFDFGPVGNDVAMGMGWNKSRCFEGEIREMDVNADELPEDHIVVGKTTMTLDDIRAFNGETFDKKYKMNTNDCRHYVNAVCSHSIGSEKRVNWTLRLVKQSYAATKSRKEMMQPCAMTTSAMKSPSSSSAIASTSTSIDTLPRAFFVPLPSMSLFASPLRGIQDATVLCGQHVFEASTFRSISYLSRTLFATLMTLSGVRTFRAPVAVPTSKALVRSSSRLMPLRTRAPKVVKASSLFATASCISETPVNIISDALSFGSKISDGVRVGATRGAALFGKVMSGMGRNVVRGLSRPFAVRRSVSARVKTIYASASSIALAPARIARSPREVLPRGRRRDSSKRRRGSDERELVLTSSSSRAP